MNLPDIFQAVVKRLEVERESLNRADATAQNHGDQVVEVFQVVERAALQKSGAGLAETMGYAAQLLREHRANETAQLYANGLEQFARQFREHQVSQDELARYARQLQVEDPRPGLKIPGGRDGEILRALVAGLAGWQQVETGQAPRVDMGYLFDLGMHYLQASERGGSRAEVLADAAVSASPLNNEPPLARSGKLAIRTLLEALAASSDHGKEETS